MTEKEPTKRELTHPPKHKIETETLNEGSAIEQTVSEDRKAEEYQGKATDKKIAEIRKKMEFNRTADKIDQKEVTLAEENLVYGKTNE